MSYLKCLSLHLKAFSSIALQHRLGRSIQVHLAALKPLAGWAGACTSAEQHCCPQFRLGGVAEEGELELSSKVLGSAPLTTRERIRRDRELHRLGLHLVERIPKDVLIDVVQVSMHTTKPVHGTVHTCMTTSHRNSPILTYASSATIGDKLTICLSDCVTQAE